MNEKTISARTFGQLCARASKADEEDAGLDRLSFEICPEVPVLLRIKNLLAEYFDVDDDGTIQRVDAETRSQALLRRIHEILDDRMDPDFQNFAALNMYIERAKALYGRKDVFGPEQSTRRNKRRGR
jgi:hypothetical protein